MSYFKWSDGPDASVGVDLDQQIYAGPVGQQINGKDPNAYGDYEVLNSPNLSGGSFVIPSQPDMGIPTRYEARDGTTDYRMDKMLDIDQTRPLEDVIMGETFNGRLHDVSIVKDAILPHGDGDLVIQKDNNETSIRGLLEKNAVNDIFFSDMNIKGLQDSIRYGVHLKTEKVISNQSSNELYTIMRSIMLQYANFQTSTDHLLDEVRRLNGKVILYSVDNVSSNVLQHIGYIADLSRLPEPIERPVLTERNNFTYDISNLL